MESIEGDGGGDGGGGVFVFLGIDDPFVLKLLIFSSSQSSLLA